MPNPERPLGSEAEHEPQPYYQAARFPGERPAGRAYQRAQDVVYQAREDVDLSAYRFQVNEGWHVAVLGKQPPDDVDQQLTQILAAGEPTTLPDPVLKLLVERRAQAITRGPWSEGHYRPGKRFVLPPDEGGEEH